MYSKYQSIKLGKTNYYIKVKDLGDIDTQMSHRVSKGILKYLKLYG